jgi:hypothetical protein
LLGQAVLDLAVLRFGDFHLRRMPYNCSVYHALTTRYLNALHQSCPHATARRKPVEQKDMPATRGA